jgi:integrase
MAGKWKSSGHPGIFVQEDRRGDTRYKAVYRDSRGVATSRTFPLLREARDFLGKTRGQRADGTLPDVSKSARTMDELWAHYEKTRESSRGGKVKPSTFASYADRYPVHIQPVFGHRRLNSLTKSGIKEFYADLEQREGLDTRRKVQQIVHRLLQVAVDDEWLTRNPADGIKNPGAVAQRKPRALTDAEVEELASEVPPRYRALVWMLAETGARPGEILALRVKNLNGSVRIVEATAEVGGRKITGTPKTDGSIRNVPISSRLRAAIRDHYDAGFANRFDPEGYVFTGERGAQVGQNNLRKRVLQPAAERAGIEGFTTYDLRHTAISLWLMKGVTPWTVAQMVGHTDLKMIQQRYGHLYDNAAQKEIDRIDQAQ